ncbi:MAG: ATP synthase F1 subunit delta, partial [Pseudomonadota bacterium]|nr:ATP synthase F1 subunit delta [Pseudomonadota bacterium]
MSALTLRYAHAFASVAESNHLDAASAQQQMRDFSDTLADSHELREFLMNPSLAVDQKLKVLDAIAGRIAMFPQVRNFLAVIMDHQRLAELDEILTEYHAVADRQSGFAEAEITSARPLTDQDRAELEAQVAKIAGGRVRATYLEDASLLGGAVVRLGSTVYDGSVRGQFQ